MPILSKQNLRYILPKAGMTYQSPHTLMHNKRRDKRVADALRTAGYDITGPTITEVLVHMFQTATPIFTSRAENEDLWDVLPRVQTQIDWARSLPQAIFFEFFVCFVEARCEWEKNPTYPHYMFDLYDPAVRELVTFRTSVGDSVASHVSWILTDAVFFNELARGLGIDEDEDEDVVMGGSGLDKDFQEEYGDPTVADVLPPMALMKIE
ncbi:hypothetical protein F4678DRAFT_459273 [Xylaria arbuscula]|nr:hypothetical protein F4678DRAFT_459273 [Xylaria arbuscula]